MNNYIGYIHVFGSCIIIHGYKKSIVLDPERDCYYLLDRNIASIIESIDGQDIENLHDLYKDIDPCIIKEIISFGLETEIIFISELDKSYFPKPSLSYDNYLPTTNMIIDIPQHINLNNFLLSLNLSKNVLSGYIEVRSFYKKIDINDLISIISTFSDCDMVLGILLTLPYYDSIDFTGTGQLFYKYPKLWSIIFHGANIDNSYKSSDNKSRQIILSTEKLESPKSCGCVHNSYFNNNFEHIRESFNFNSCLNRKVSIDSDGNIKNCPSMPESYGNIKDTTLAEALEKPGFKKYWDINKDKIHVCKDCEFRYICTDCRAYVEDPEDIYSKPLKCGYNPYTGEWSEWSTNPLKQKAIDFYGMREMVDGMNKNADNPSSNNKTL